MVYNRHFFSMKKALFALIIAFPMIFSGCSKDDNRTSSGVPPQYIDFAKINSWIGTSEADVANELLQLGFEKKMITTNTLAWSHTFLSHSAHIR